MKIITYISFILDGEHWNGEKFVDTSECGESFTFHGEDIQLQWDLIKNFLGEGIRKVELQTYTGCAHMEKVDQDLIDALYFAGLEE